jgi:hypothetical protein
MMKNAGAVLILLATLMRPGYAAEPPVIASSAALAESMRGARLSDGFEARMNVSAVQPDGRRIALLKLAVVGQFSAERERLQIRGIAPDRIRNRYFAAESRADGGIRSIAYGENFSSGIAETDPFAKLFDSELVIWDMFASWWSWPKQSIGGTEQLAGRDCNIVKSQIDAASSPVREVISCVDKNARISLRTQLFDGRHTLIRTISVEQMMRKESGAMAAKRMLITSADNSITEIEVYSGDQHYLVTADTFGALDYRPAVTR